jgi:hypothetical protein
LPALFAALPGRTRKSVYARRQAGSGSDELNARGMLTRRGGRWHVSTVMYLLDRLGLREVNCHEATYAGHGA